MRAPVVAVALLVASTRVVRADEAKPAAVVEVNKPKRTSRAKWIAAAGIGAFHGAFLVWQSLAWDRKGTEPFHYEVHPAFGVDTYSGGADKLGHAWATYALTRGTTAALTAAGWPTLPSSGVSFVLSEAAFLVIEVQDGHAPYGFDKKDFAANLIGGAVGVLLDNVPAVDRLLDFRLEYWPSNRYRKNFRETGDLDGAQDYTGQSYLLALHLGAALPESDYTYWARFVDVAVGFEGKHYYPQPDDRMPRQTLYAGLAINMQGVLSHLFADSTGRRIGRGIFEAYSLPYTTFRFAEASRHPSL